MIVRLNWIGGERHVIINTHQTLGGKKLPLWKYSHRICALPWLIRISHRIQFQKLTINKKYPIRARKWSESEKSLIYLRNNYKRSIFPLAESTQPSALWLIWNDKVQQEFVRFYFRGNYKRKKWLIFHTFDRRYRCGNMKQKIYIHYIKPEP